MKKTTKSMLITALILFCAGLLLALGSALFVKIRGIDPFGVPHITKVIENKELSLNDILSASPDSNYMKKLSKKEYSRVSFTSFAGDIEIYSTEGETKVELLDANTSNLNVEIIGETLTVEEIDGVSFMGIHINRDGFSFKGLRQIFGSGNSANSTKVIKLYLSKNIAVDQIDISSIIGDITVDSISTELTNIYADFGNISIDALSSVSGKLNIKGSVNNVKLSNMENITSTVSTRIGDIEADIGGKSDFNTILDAWLGNITVKTEEPTSFYKLALSSTLGNVLRNGEPFGQKLNDSSTTAKRVTAATIFGDVSIAFIDGDENKYKENLEENITSEQNETMDQEPSTSSTETIPAA